MVTKSNRLAVSEMAISIKIIASSSAANCYRLDDGGTALLLEAGLPIGKIKKALDFKVSALRACLVTHEHLDHAQSVKDLMLAGIDCYMSQGTADKRNVTGHRLKIIKAMTQFELGPWTILPFHTIHDAAEPLGFLLASGDDKLLFATDTAYLEYTFQGLTHIMIECNYTEDILEENIRTGLVSHEARHRLVNSHFGLGNVIKLLKANDLSALQEIHLLHLSDRNSDEVEIKRAIQKITGVPCYVAGK